MLVSRLSWNRFIFEKVHFHETSAGVVSGAFPGPQDGIQDDPRSPQDGSKIVLDRFVLPLDFSLRYWIVFGSVLVPIWPPKRLPRGATKLGFGGPLGVEDGLEIVLVWFSCRLVVRDRFFGRLGLLLGSFWDAPGGHLGAFSAFQLIDSTHQLINSSIQPINSSTHRFNSSTHQLVDSTHQLINPSISTFQPINSSKGLKRAEKD